MTLTINAGSGGFFLDRFCNDSTDDTHEIPATKNSLTLYFRTQAAVDVQIAVQVSGLSTVTQRYYLRSGQPTQLVVLEAGTVITSADYRAGDCKPLEVQVRDAFGNPAAVTQETGMTVSIVLPNGSEFELYGTSASCPATSNGSGTTIDSFVIPKTQSSKTVYLRQRRVIQDHRVSFSGTNQSGQQLTGAVVTDIHAGKPKVFILSGGSTQIVAGSCVATKYTVALRDQWGNDAIAVNDSEVNTPITANLSTTRGHADDDFFSSASCTGASVDSVTIPGGQHSIDFSFTAKRATLEQPGNPPQVTVQTTASGMTSATASLHVEPKPATVLALTHLNTQPALAGQCVGIKAEAKDEYGNNSNVDSDATLAFSNTASSYIRSNSGCSATNAVKILSGSSEQTFYFRRDDVPNAPGDTSLTVTVTASGGLADSEDRGILLRPNVPTTLTLLDSTPITVVAGDCTNMTVQARDAHGNLTGNHGNLSLTGNDGGSSGSFNGPGCSGALGSIASGSAERTFGFRATLASASPYTIRVSSGLLTDATRSVTVIADTPDAFVISPAPGPVDLTIDDTCGVFSLAVKDEWGNNASFGSATTVSFTTSPVTAAATLFDNGSCSGPGGFSISLGASATGKTFSLKGAKVADVTLNASAGGVTGAYSTLRIERIDLSFGTDGEREYDLFSGRPELPASMTFLSDGRFATAGYVDVGSGNKDFFVAVFNADGTLYTTGWAGKRSVGFGSANDRANAIVQISGGPHAGKLLAAGCASPAGNDSIAFLVLDPNDGSVDFQTTYDFRDLGLADCAYAATAGTSGKIYLAGHAGTSPRDAIVLLVDTNDLVDPFVAPSERTLQFDSGANEEGRAITPSAAGLYVGGARDDDYLLFRVTDSGGTLSLDTSFASPAGYATRNFGGPAVATAAVVQSGGQIVLAGHRTLAGNTDWALVRFSSLGAFLDDETLNLAGTDFAYAAAVHPSGPRANEIVVVGKIGPNAAVGRFKADLSDKDPTFGKGGVGYVTTDFGSSTEEFLGMGIDSSNRIYGIGYTDNATRDTAIGRYSGK